MRITKITLLFIILLSMAVSPLQRRFHLFREAPLHGYFIPVPMPELKFFTWGRWFGSVFQDEMTTRLNENIGLRNPLIRIRNQYDWSLFGLTHAQGFLEGKDRYFFEEDYIHEYSGRYFVGTNVIERKLSRLKNVMDSLAVYHIPLILVFEPGKASFYPEYIPDRFSPAKRTISNYDYFSKRAEELGLTVLDLNRYFLQMKDTSRYPLFPRYGMHWSMYGAHLAAGKLSGFIGKVTAKPMPGFKSCELQPTDKSPGTDYDIGDMMNLVWRLPSTPGVNPVVPFASIPDGTLPALVVADSYYLNLVETYSKKMFGKSDFWYYNSSVYPHQNDYPSVKIDKSGLREKLKQYKVVLLMVSEINLHCCFWNFADEAYRAFHPTMKFSQLDNIENAIWVDREWFRFMVGRAKAQRLPLDRMVRENAEYTFSSGYKDSPGKTYWDTVEYISLNIKNNAEWYAQVKKTAHDEHRSLDSVILLNAIYSYEQSKNKH
ncbi:MAG: hypothetical protein WCK34_04095 [Bacteroidota bacterium]